MSEQRTLEHVAIVSDDRSAVIAELVPDIEGAIARDERVLISGDAPLRDGFSAALGSLRSHVTFMDAGSRYARPVDAIATISRLVREGDGRPFHTIGEIPVAAGTVDPMWLWYEAAFTEVMSTQPVVATCLYDRGALSESAIAQVASAHPLTVNDGEPPSAEAFGSLPTPSGPSLSVPDRPPTASLTGVRDAATARDLMSSLDVSDDVLDRARLVVSELVTNAIRHGGGEASIEAWEDDGTLRLRVRDVGPGVSDPFAPLRPPDVLAEGGAGIWICSMESDRLAIDGGVGGTSVTVEIRPRRPA